MHKCQECNQAFEKAIDFYHHPCTLLMLFKEFITTLEETNKTLKRIADLITIGMAR